MGQRGEHHRPPVGISLIARLPPSVAHAMIHDVDEVLRALVRRDALSDAQVEIAFDAPNREWVARRNAPTLDLYLYDIREDLQRREVAYEAIRNEQGIVTEHRPPARRFRLSYLVTAWTQRPEDEHRILSAALACFIRNPVLPADLLTGALAEATVPSYLTVALPPPQDRSLADVWSALGGELKPSLDLVVTAPLDASIKVEAAPAVLEHPRIRVLLADGTGEVEEGAAAAAAGGATGGGLAGGATRTRTWRGGRRPLGPGDPAVQEEERFGGGPRSPAGDAGGTGGTGKAKKHGKGAGSGGDADDTSAAATGTDAARVPGRRITVRGIERP